MFKNILAMLLSVSVFSLAEEGSDVGLIITNYQYDSFGRPIRTSQTTQTYPYYNNNPYYYNDPYYQTNLPGSDPDRFEDIFEKNSRR